MKTRLLTSMCMATVIGLGAAMSAQTGTTAKDQMGKDKIAKDGQMTVSGCVAASKEPGQFMLTNAMMAGAMNKETMGKDKMKPEAGGAHSMSYELVGGTNLKAHMGHRVEVTGSMSKTDMDQHAKMDTMAKDKAMANKALKLNVTSVKMISANCP